MQCMLDFVSRFVKVVELAYRQHLNLKSKISFKMHMHITHDSKLKSKTANTSRPLFCLVLAGRGST